MANICLNYVTLFEQNDDQIKLKRAYEKLLAAYEEAQNEFGDVNLLDLLEVLWVDSKKTNGLDGRSWITYMDLQINDSEIEGIILDIESAWSPCEDALALLRKALGRTFKFVYVAEEPGCEVFVNTDIEHRFYTDIYNVEIYAESEEEGIISEVFHIQAYDHSDEECLNYIHSLSGLKYKSIEDLIANKEGVEKAIDEKYHCEGTASIRINEYGSAFLNCSRILITRCSPAPILKEEY